MIRPWRVKWIALGVGIGVAGSYVSGWVGAVIAQREAARPPAAVPLIGYLGPPPAADPDLVAEAPTGWPVNGWRVLRGSRSGEHAFQAFEPANGGLCMMTITRERHGWPWQGVQSVALEARYSPPRTARAPREERVAKAVDALGLERAVWAPFEPADAGDPGGYIAIKDLQPFWRRGLSVANPGAPPKRHTLPLDPVWPGFAYNALVFGGGAWALLAAPSLVGLALGRKRRRRERGLCVACGYDLAGLGLCSECGRKAG